MHRPARLMQNYNPITADLSHATEIRRMSHHFDTPTARQDPRLNLCDFYLFDGPGETTVMVMTVNPDAGKTAPDTFRDEGIYAFRFDLNDDAREELTFKFRFGPAGHAEGDEHTHTQTFEVFKAQGTDALRGAGGESLASGRLGEIAQTSAGVRAFAGLAGDLFAGDAAALGAFRKAFYEENRFHAAAFDNRQNFFANRNVTAIVLQVPDAMLGARALRAWATISLFGHAPEVQVSRWGMPLLTHLFMPDPQMKEDYNRSEPAEDAVRFAPQASDVIGRITRLANPGCNPTVYAARAVDRLFPTTLPFTPGTPASFDFAGFNGRALTDDVMDVMLSLMTNTALGDGVAPDARRVRDAFPYVPLPYPD
jgi:hypothetical protein